MKTYKSKILDEFFKIKDKSKYNKLLTKMTIAKNISESMAHNKISKKQLAIAMKKQPSVITKWLSGNHNFTIDTLVELQDYLNVPLLTFVI